MSAAHTVQLTLLRRNSVNVFSQHMPEPMESSPLAEKKTVVKATRYVIEKWTWAMSNTNARHIELDQNHSVHRALCACYSSCNTIQCTSKQLDNV